VLPLDTVMQAADQLRDEKGIVFAFIGGGSEFARVKKGPLAPALRPSGCATLH
jgi:hypothetical protein